MTNELLEAIGTLGGLLLAALIIWSSTASPGISQEDSDDFDNWLDEHPEEDNR